MALFTTKKIAVAAAAGLGGAGALTSGPASSEIELRSASALQLRMNGRDKKLVAIWVQRNQLLERARALQSGGCEGEASSCSQIKALKRRMGCVCRYYTAETQQPRGTPRLGRRPCSRR